MILLDLKSSSKTPNERSFWFALSALIFVLITDRVNPCFLHSERYNSVHLAIPPEGGGSGERRAILISISFDQQSFLRI